MVFESLAREGELDSPLSPEDLAAAYLASSDGHQIQWLYDPSAIDPSRVLHSFLQSIIPR